MSDIMPDDWPESEEFYNLMQVYRHVNQHHFEGEGKTVEAYRAVKEYLRAEVVDMIEVGRKDAERYRWLRSFIGRDDALTALHLPEPQTAAEMDTTIDAAIEKDHD